MHKKAFDAVCNFVLTNVIGKNKCFYTFYSESMFIEFTKNYATDPAVNVEPYNLEKRLLEKFPKKITIVTVGVHGTVFNLIIC